MYNLTNSLRNSTIVSIFAITYIFMTEKDKKEFYLELGAQIQIARKKANLSQDELSKRVNKSRASIVNIEKARQHPPLHLLWDISEILQVNICNLISNFTPSTEEDVLKGVFKKELTKTSKKTQINKESLVKFSKFLKKS